MSAQLEQVGPAPIVTTITARSFDPGAATVKEIPAGATIAEIVGCELGGATADQLSRTVVVIVSQRGEWEIAAAYWSRTRPLPGMTVRIHVQLMGRDVLRLVLSIAAFAAASFLGPLLLPAGLPAVLGTAALGIVGSLVVNALVPLEQPKQPPAAESRYSISGFRNEARPFAPIPEIHGKMRIFPPYASLPFTETVGEDRYVRALLLLGYADLAFSDWKIGETPLEEFRDSELQVVKLAPGDDWPFDGYPNPVFETEERITLKQTDGWQTRRTARNVDYVSLEILFEEGCGYVDKKGNVDAQTYEFEIRRRRVRNDGSFGEYKTIISPLKVFEGTTTPFRVTHAWLEDEPGQWEVGVRRLTLDGDNILGALEKTAWVVLRGVRPVVPVKFNKPIHLAYLRLRATGQAQGVLDRINCIASSIRWDFDPQSETWVYRETQSPAAHARRVLQGPANAFPVDDDELDLEDLEKLARFCRNKGLDVNVVHDDERSVESALKQVMRGGRAYPTRHNGLRGCFIDRPQTVVRGHVASVNASDFEGDPVYEKPVDALRVKFLDETDGYRSTERIVPRPGLSHAPKTFEEIDFGVYTSPKLNWIEARRLHLEREYRWERKYAVQDAEHLFAPPGSLVMAHFLTVDQRQVSARVRAVFDDLVVLTEQVTMRPGESYACRFRSSTGQSYVRAVETDAGEPTDTIRLSGNGLVPQAGDIAMFGLLGAEASEMIVKAIEPQKDLRARLMLVPHAPEIEALAEAAPPDWFPIDQVPRGWAAKKPAVPVIVSCKTVFPTLLDNGAPEEKGVIVIVRVKEGVGSRAPTDTILITIEGVDEPSSPPEENPKPPAEIERSVTAGLGVAEFHYHTIGDQISIRARAYSIFGQFSAQTDAKLYTVKRPKRPPPNVTHLAITRRSDGRRRYRFELDPDASRADKRDVAGYRVFARPGAGWQFDELAPLVRGVIANSPFESRRPFTTGPHVFAAVAVDEAGAQSAEPFLINRTLPSSLSTELLLQRIETIENWNGSIDVGERQGGRLVSQAAGSRIVYRTPTIDLGANLDIDVNADVYGAVTDVVLEMRTGRTSDDGVAGSWERLDETTARYVQVRATVDNGAYDARLGDLVTTIQPV